MLQLTLSILFNFYFRKANILTIRSTALVLTIFDIWVN